MVLATLLVVFGFGQASALSSPSMDPTPPGSVPAITRGTDPNALPDLPNLQPGKSSTIGGNIRKLDRIRDQINIDVFGGKRLTLLFDARTHIFRDGKAATIQDLRPGDHISVETVLDGTAVFARSIHMLTTVPAAQFQGQVVDFDRGKQELVLRDSLAAEPVRLRVASTTQVSRIGQPSVTVADLTPNTLVSVVYEGSGASGVAKQISLLASPGNTFVFAGKLTFLDMHAGTLVVLDPRDQKRYDISFERSRLPGSTELREGSDVSVTAEFDGRQYEAKKISVLKPQLEKP